MRRIYFASLTAAIVVNFASIASAADMPVKARPITPAVGYNWTGFYAGLSGGYASEANAPLATFSDPFLTAPASPPFYTFAATSLGAPNLKGGIFGGQIGYNKQFERTVVGLEADFSWADLEGTNSASVSGSVPGLVNSTTTTTLTRKLDWFGTARARIGFLPTERMLLYVTGGLAFGKTDSSVSVFLNQEGGGSLSFASGSATLTCAVGTYCVAASENKISIGWTAGAGLEYAVWDRVTLKLEYLFVDLNTPTTMTFTNATGYKYQAQFDNSSLQLHVARLGLNYKF